MQTRDDVLAFAFPLAKKYAAEVTKRYRVHQDDIESDVMLAVTEGLDSYPYSSPPVEPEAWWRNVFGCRSKNCVRGLARKRKHTVSIDDEEAPDENPAYADPRSTAGFEMVDLVDFCGESNREFVRAVVSGTGVIDASGSKSGWQAKKRQLKESLEGLGIGRGDNGNRVSAAAA
jgi:hypothetical protein